jgi:cytidine deaminase
VPARKAGRPAAATGGARSSPAARRTALARAARTARARAHAPYSGFRVGAAVLAGGRIHSGCNVENASYGLTVCAERNAVGAAVLAGAGRLDAVAVATDTEVPTPPCGACLQVLAELGGPELEVALWGRGPSPVVFTLGQLMPHTFGAENLQDRAVRSRPSPSRRRRTS